MQTVLVTGATGFIGSHLLHYLLQHHFQVIALSRKMHISNHVNLQWIDSLTALENISLDYVVNLAGESIGQGRWTAARKQKLIQSRYHKKIVSSTSTLSN